MKQALSEQKLKFVTQTDCAKKPAALWQTCLPKSPECCPESTAHGFPVLLSNYTGDKS